MDDDTFDEIISILNQNNNKPSFWQLFERFAFIYSVNDCSNFKLINNSFPFWEKLEFRYYLSRDLEIVTNPMLYQNGIKSLKFISNCKNIHLSDNFISNIWEIKPKSVLIESGKFEYEKELNFIGVLQKLSSKMKIKLKIGYFERWISLIFSNTVLKISQNDGDNSTFFEWKSFLYEISSDNIKDIKFEDHSSKPDLDWLTLKLRKNFKVEFEDFSPIPKDQASKYNSCFPQFIWDNESWWTVTVLVKDLNKFEIYSSFEPINDPDETINRLVSKWSRLKYFYYELKFPKDFKCLDNIIRFFPQNWIFTVKIELEDIQILI